MPDKQDNKLTDLQQQQEAEIQFAEMQTKTAKVEAEISKTVDQLKSGSLEWFAKSNLREGDKQEVKGKYQSLLEGLSIFKWEMTVYKTEDEEKFLKEKNLTQTSVADVMEAININKLTSDQEIGDWIKVLRDKMETVLLVWNKVLGDVKNIDDEFQRNTDLYSLQDENKEEREKEGKNIFKLPMRSVKDIYEDEIERKLLMRLDAQRVLEDNVLPLRSYAQELREIYHRHEPMIDLSSDSHDDSRFLWRINDILDPTKRNYTNSELTEKTQSLDLANFVIDSRKFIVSLKRRI